MTQSGASHPDRLWVIPPPLIPAARPSHGFLLKPPSTTRPDGKPLCFSSFSRWICPTGSPRERYERGSAVVALEGVAALLGLGDMAQLLKMLPRDSRWWLGRAGCWDGGGGDWQGPQGAEEGGNTPLILGMPPSAGPALRGGPLHHPAPPGQA